MSLTLPNPGAQWNDSAAALPAQIMTFVQDPVTLIWGLIQAPLFGAIKGSLTRHVSGADVLTVGLTSPAKRPIRTPSGAVIFF